MTTAFTVAERPYEPSPAFQSRDNERIRPQSRQRRLNLLICLNRRCRDWNDYLTAPRL